MLVAGLLKPTSGGVLAAQREVRGAGAPGVRTGLAFQNPTHAAVAHDPRQRDDPAQDRRAVSPRLGEKMQGRIRRARRGAASAGRPQGLRRQAALAAVGRHAAARVAVPRAGASAAAAAARRAVRRARPVHARGTLGHHAGALDARAADRAAGHARPARVGVPGEPHLRDEFAPGPHPRGARGAVRAAAHARSELLARVRAGWCSSCACASRRRARRPSRRPPSLPSPRCPHERAEPQKPAARAVGRGARGFLRAVGTRLSRVQRVGPDPAAPEPDRARAVAEDAAAVAACGADALHDADRFRARRRGRQS